MAYDENSVVDVGRLSTYDSLIKDHVETRLQDITNGVDITGKNLLYNADFRDPVNRNGKQSYDQGNQGTIDGWFMTENIGTGKFTVGDGFIRFPTNGGFILSQHLGSKLSGLLLNKTVTLSCLTRTNFYTVTAELGAADGYVDTYGISFAGGWWIDVYGPTNDLSVRVFTPQNIKATANLDIVALKLEYGSTQTLAKQDDVGKWVMIDIPNKAAQFAICSQYSPITCEYVGPQNVNSNMIDNWYFKNPVNRNNITSITGTEQWVMPIDRWFSVRATTTLTADGLSVRTQSGLSTDYCALMQRIKYNYSATQYTVSAIVDGEIHYATLMSPDGSDQYAINISPFVNGIAFGLQTINGGYMSIYIYVQSTTAKVIKAVKCELGSIQTLAHKDSSGKVILNDPPSNYELEYVKCVQYDINTGDYIGLNASTVKALSVESGGVVEGDIIISKSSAPMMALKNEAVSAEAKIVVTDDIGAAEMVTGALDDEDNKAILRLNRETSSLEEAVQVERVVDGESNVYNLYGEHNKPTPSDIGAASESALEELKTSTTTNFDESIIGLSVSGTTVTYIKGDGSVHTFETQDTNTTYSLGTDQETGLTKLYATIGSAEDGTMTQKAIKTELDKKVGVRLNNNTLVFTI